MARASSLVSEPILIDLAATARDHPLRRLAADDEGAGQVRLDDLPPLGRGKLDHRLAQLDAGIVDENVDLDALGVEPLEGGDYGRLVGDVEAGLMDRVPGRLHLLGSRGQASLIGAVQHDRGAGGGQPFRHRAPKAARRSGDEGGAALERKQVGGHRRFLKTARTAHGEIGTLEDGRQQFGAEPGAFHRVDVAVLDRPALQ